MRNVFCNIVLIVSFFLVPGLQRGGDDPVEWMQYRGPGGAGHSLSTASFPETLDFATELKWKIDLLPGHSSPIVVGDAIILTGFEPGKLSTLCFERATGELRWRQDLEVPSFERTHPQHGPVTPTPASDGHRVFVTFGSFGIIAYDLQGNERWRVRKDPERNLFGTASSPIIVDQKLIVFTGNQNQSLLQAIDPTNGKLIWERRRRGAASSWATPVVWKTESETQLLIYEPFHLRCVSLSDGSDIWSVPGLADEPITMPQLHDGLVIATSYNMKLNREVLGPPTFDVLLEQCDANQNGTIDLEESKTNQSVLSRPDADGQGDHPLRMFFRTLDENRDGEIQASEYPRLKAWVDTFEHANGFVAFRPTETNSAPKHVWQQEVGVPECPSPIVIDEYLFAVRNGGVVTCLDIQTGKRLSHDLIASTGPYYAAPVTGDGKIYFASQRGHVTVVSAEPNPRVLSNANLGDPIHATPALAAGQLIIRSKRHLWLFEKPGNDK